MHKLPLDPDELAVSTFEPAPARLAAARVASVETNDEVCYCLSIMPEDCFGPTAGCSTDHTEA